MALLMHYSSLKPKKHFAKEIRIIVRLVIAQENMFKLMSVFFCVFMCTHKCGFEFLSAPPPVRTAAFAYSAALNFSIFLNMIFKRIYGRKLFFANIYFNKVKMEYS